MDTIVLRPLYHRGKETIAIKAPNVPALNLVIRQSKDVRWSQTQSFAGSQKESGVLKRGSIQLLRNSSATHLIEKSIDIQMIQKLLGHNNIATTLRYLHTSNKDLLKIISPLNDLPLR